MAERQPLSHYALIITKLLFKTPVWVVAQQSLRSGIVCVSTLPVRNSRENRQENNFEHYTDPCLLCLG